MPLHSNKNMIHSIDFVHSTSNSENGASVSGLNQDKQIEEIIPQKKNVVKTSTRNQHL